MTYLVDTDWVVDYLKGLADAVSLIPSLQPDGVAISIITFTEVYEGIYGGRDPIESERLFRAFLRIARVIGINRTVGRQAARIRLDLRRRSLLVDHRALDIIIAATAMTHDLTLVTRNSRHFSDINGLTLY